MFGGMGASSLLGSKTGDVLTWVTIGLVALFLVLGVLLDKSLKNQSQRFLAVPPAASVPAAAESAAPEGPAQTSQQAAPGQSADGSAPAAPAEAAESSQ